MAWAVVYCKALKGLVDRTTSCKNRKGMFWLCLGTFLGFSSCTDPVTPEFELREGLVFVEGFVSTTPGASFVEINQSAFEFGVYTVSFVENATVRYECLDSGEVVLLTAADQAYLPSEDFEVSPGERWKLLVDLPDGRRYESFPELVLEPVPITDLKVAYDAELEFREGDGGGFIPGHRAMVSFEDPSDRENYYYWTYRTYENLVICQRCVEGYFRDGECQRFPPSVSGIPFFDYLCKDDCWRIRFPERVTVFSDKFSNGKTVTDLSIGNLPLYTDQDMVLVLQQLSLTSEAFEYYEVLEDIVDNNGGLNAPPPAGLVGNMFNVENSDDFVFGRFTAAATTTASIFIERSDIPETALEIRGPTRYEEEGDPVPPQITGTTVCSENKYRTAIPPPGWISN